MSVKEASGVMGTVDQNGNQVIHYPITKLGLVEGLPESLATSEENSTASRAYAVGEFLIYKNRLYCVTAAIAQGDTITVGTNITATDVGAQIKNNADGLATLSQEVARKAPLASPALTGTPTAPTPAVGDNSTQIATTAFVAANAAPAGFGLGKLDAEAPPNSDANNAVANGWFVFAGNSPTGAWWRGFVIRASNVITQYAFSINGASGIENAIVCQRTGQYDNSTETYAWQPWEYVNPPLGANVEYRTTERFLRKPVYVKVLPVTWTTGVNNHGIPNIDTIVRFNATRGGNPAPSIENNNLSDPWSYYVAYVNATQLALFAGTSAAGASGTVTLYYTKTTD